MQKNKAISYINVNSVRGLIILLRLEIDKKVDDKMKVLREQLNKQIEINESYEKVLMTSAMLDELISKYYDGLSGGNVLSQS